MTDHRFIACIVGVLLSLPALAQTQQSNFSAEDKATMRNYVLTAEKFDAFIDGLTALATAKNGDPSLAREVDVMDRKPAGTLADLRTQLLAHPRAFDFYQRRGLTAEDTVLIPLVAGYAAAAIPVNNAILFADRITPAQVNFIRTNSALMERLGRAYAVLSTGN